MSVSSLVPPLAQAMVLAAGRGERMRPLTDTTPKPLLSVRGKPLLHWHLDALARAAWQQVLINTAWLGEQIPAACGTTWSVATGGSPPMGLQYAMEGPAFGTALETAGGIVHALPHLAEVFWVLAGDVYVPGFPFAVAAMQRFMDSDALAHIWLVPNPAHHPRGDFVLSASGLALNVPGTPDHPRYTYSTIGLYRREFFAEGYSGIPAGNPRGQTAALGPLLRAAMDRGQVSAELWIGAWTDVGTVERLNILNQEQTA